MSNQIPLIYDQAIKRYKEITNNELNDIEFLQIRNVDDLIKEVHKRNKDFVNFRRKRQIFFEVLQGAMKPIELVGNITAGGVASFPPSAFVFGAIIYLI